MRRRPDLGELHISLATATALAYRHLMDEPLITAIGHARNDLVHAVAHALSNVCRIYSTTEDGKVIQISYLDLVDGRFDHGAAILRAANGTLYRRLSVSRDDLHAAMTILKNVGVKFARGDAQ